MKNGDWIDGYDGIGQIQQIAEYFIEEYRQEYLRDKQIGAPLHTLIAYKMLCNFDGKLRKRNNFISCDASFCSPISSDSRSIIDDVKNKYCEEFENFLNLKLVDPLKHDITSWLLVPESMSQKVADAINEFNGNVSNDFTFDQLIHFVDEKFPGIDLFDTSNMRTANNVVLVLDNRGFKVNEKRALFSGVKAFVK